MEVFDDLWAIAMWALAWAFCIGVVVFFYLWAAGAWA